MKRTILGGRRVLWLAVAVVVAGAFALGTGARAQASGGSTATAEAPDSVGTVPAPALFDVAWGDLSDILATVRPEARDAAAQLTTAPIYHLDLRLVAPRRLEGDMEVRVVNDGTDAWRDVVFFQHAVRLGADVEVTNLRLDGQPLEPTVLDDHGTFAVSMRGLPGGELAPGGAAVVALSYRLDVPVDASGNYGLLSLDGGVLSLPHAYPTLAARDAGGWDLDVPAPHGDLGTSEVGFYRVRVSLPGTLALAASGQTTATVMGARTLHEIRAGPVRDVFFSISDFEPTETEAGDVHVRSWARPGDEAAAARAAGIAAEALDVFGRLYGAYPYTEFDLVPMATSALGVEFPGIVALTLGLYGQPSAVFEGVVVHEVAHQWFYGLLAVDQVTTPWLDEALAQYATLRYYEERYGPAGGAGFRGSLVQRNGRIPNPGSRFLGDPVEAYSGAAYGALIYGTAPLVLDELRRSLPDGTFDRAIADLVARRLWQRPSGSDLFAAVAEACGCEVDPAIVARFERTED